MNLKIYYTYIHYRASDGEPFYVGKGTYYKGKTIEKCYRRAYNECRNDEYDKCFKQHGRIVFISKHFTSEEEAYKEEKRLIKLFQLENYVLTNVSKGGNLMLKGENHPQFKGWYHTPWIKRASSKEAFNHSGNVTNMSQSQIIGACKKTSKKYRNNKYKDFWFESRKSKYSD